MRLENSVKNIKYNIISQVICLVVQFVSRTFFIKILGNEYLGITGIFNSILTLLSLADMGILTVVVYSMYEPLADKNENKLKMLINEYRKIYNRIALIVFILGICFVPFLHLFTKNTINISNIEFIFILYLLNTITSYLFVYKISIINADQKNYIVSVIEQVFNIITNIVMIFVLLVTHNFILYLMVQTMFTIISNIYLSKKAEKMYPFIKKTKGYNLDIMEKEKIKKDTFAMMFHKIGGVIVSGTDNLVLFLMVGLEEVGIYSNYVLIISYIKKFASQYFKSITASLGNLNAKSSKEYSFLIFKKVFFGNFWIYIFCAICLYFLLNPFIEIWIGKEFVFNNSIVFAIVLAFYVDGMRQTVLCFREAMGIFYQDRFKPIIESILNVVISIVLTKQFGIIGIALGTMFSMLLTCIWVEPYVLFKYGFSLKVRIYFKIFLKYVLMGIFTFFITLLANQFIIGNSVFKFLCRLIVTIIVSNLTIIILNFKTEEFKYFSDIIKNLLKL